MAKERGRRRKQKRTTVVSRWIFRFAEAVDRSDRNNVPRGTRGIYALLQQNRAGYDVVYVGISASGIRGRLAKHDKAKADGWSHFSVFEVWPNVSEDELRQLEGIIRQLYHLDARANALNLQRKMHMLSHVHEKHLKGWKRIGLPTRLAKRMGQGASSDDES